MGYQIGSFVASFRDGLADSLSYPIIERENKSISINYYCDINTNKRNNLLLQDQTKETNFSIFIYCAI